jgi:hypothetical protein
MKKKKKRINSFKNWLLARDSASRISTVPTYHSFLESSQPLIRDRSQIMDLFDSITESKPFYKLNQIINFGMAKDAKEKKINIWLPNSYSQDILKFLECLNPKSVGDLSPMIFIKLIAKEFYELKDTEIYKERSESGRCMIYLLIQESLVDSQIVQESQKVIKYWIENVDLEDELSTNFFKWWMENYIFKQDKYSNFLKSFESAFVEWMRTVPPKEAGEAYLRIINNSKKETIRRRNTDIGTKEIIDHINQGIVQFNIKIEDLKASTDLLRDFDIL